MRNRSRRLHAARPYPCGQCHETVHSTTGPRKEATAVISQERSARTEYRRGSGRAAGEAVTHKADNGPALPGQDFYSGEAASQAKSEREWDEDWSTWSSYRLGRTCLKCDSLHTRTHTTKPSEVSNEGIVSVTIFYQNFRPYYIFTLPEFTREGHHVVKIRSKSGVVADSCQVLRCLPI